MRHLFRKLTLPRCTGSLLVAAALLLAGYLFISFYRVMDGGLNETRRHLRAMTEGDLTTSPSPWGRDEAAQLADRIEELFDYGAHLKLARDFPELQGADLRKWRDAAVVAEFRHSTAPAADGKKPKRRKSGKGVKVLDTDGARHVSSGVLSLVHDAVSRRIAAG